VPPTKYKIRVSQNNRYPAPSPTNTLCTTKKIISSTTTPTPTPAPSQIVTRIIKQQQQHNKNLKISETTTMKSEVSNTSTTQSNTNDSNNGCYFNYHHDESVDWTNATEATSFSEHDDDHDGLEDDNNEKYWKNGVKRQ
jgi:hypothetical protein